MRLLIVTGMSGAGKSNALKNLEDMGCFCIDNLPVFLLKSFARLLYMPDSGMPNAAVGIDIRNGQGLNELEDTFTWLQEHSMEYEILYLDCSTENLVKRFKETRRNHPLAANGRIEDGIALERTRIAFLRKRANYIIDTSNLLTRELRSQLEKIVTSGNQFQNLMVTILSFGYKYGIPADADLVFDVRFLPNPYYDLKLRPKTGNDKEIQEFVLSSPQCQTFLDHLYSMLDFLIPNYIDEGKNSLVIAIGCTGGKHRSVTIANMLFQHFESMAAIGVRLDHRDLILNR